MMDIEGGLKSIHIIYECDFMVISSMLITFPYLSSRIVDKAPPMSNVDAML